jgi:ADP-ribosylglycohydrolase
MKHIWLYISKTDLETERRQCEEEGRDLAGLQEEFDRVGALDLEDLSNQPQAQALLDRAITLPIREDYPYHEPSDLEGIRAARPQNRPSLPAWKGGDALLEEKVYGAWLGRCCGCLLGKPVEGWRRERMWGYLKESGRWPLGDYFSRSVSEAVRHKYDLRPWAFKEDVSFMPEDDDTNYTTSGLVIMKRHGRDFTPTDVANFWMSDIPILHTCTAERVAYRNFCNLIPPPLSASFRNPYREWIGAQIRADFFGWAAPGDPQLAAEFAWRDACISHVKNGIYGEMWVAAMLAAAYVTDDIPTIIQAGLGEIPERCRLAEDVRAVLAWHAEGIAYDEALERLHGKWNEHRAHDWCHTISNAMLVAIGLLWGELDYGRSICRAVQGCFDTDCNGATVGSVVGVVLGKSALPDFWTQQIHDTLKTGVVGYHEVKLADLTRDSLAVIEKIHA